MAHTHACMGACPQTMYTLWQMIQEASASENEVRTIFNDKRIPDPVVVVFEFGEWSK